MAGSTGVQRSLTGLSTDPPDYDEKDLFVRKLLHRDGVGWKTPGCSGSGGGSSRSLGMPPASAGFSAGTALALVLLVVVLVGWCRRCAALRRLSRAPALQEAPEDPERPLRPSLKPRRRRRQLRRLLRLRRQHVHFNEAVDVNEFFQMSATTLAATAGGRPGLRRGRQGSIFVSQDGQGTSDEDADEEDLSEPESSPQPDTSTEDKNM